MNKRFLTTMFLTVFVIVAMSGLYLPIMTHMGHDMGCLIPSSTGACISPLAHIGHWQSSFAAVMTGLFILVAVALVFSVWVVQFTDRSPQFVRYRLGERAPARPTLFQELFSCGILNRREPYDSQGGLSIT